MVYEHCGAICKQNNKAHATSDVIQVQMNLSRAQINYSRLSKVTSELYQCVLRT